MRNKNTSAFWVRGFTLVETVIGISLFVVISLSVYEGYLAVVNAVKLANIKLVAANLANEQFEIVRNLPYADVGIVNGVPAGKIPYTQSLVRGGYTFTVTVVVRNIDIPFDGVIGGNPNDLSPADNKLIEFTIACSTCQNFTALRFTGQVAPKNLETASTNGALFVRVFDAFGVEVSGASVHVESVSGSPIVDIQDSTNASGVLQIVDIPPGVERYKITATKSGFSTAQTYPSGAPENPNPVNPHVTVILQQVTQVSFFIDALSTVFVSSVRDTCTPVADVGFSITGSKLIGTTPDIPKFSGSFETDANGSRTLGSMEWDTYSLSLADETYDLIGSNPLTPFILNPGSTQNLQLVVAPKDPRSLMVTVKDFATGLPLSNANVLLEDGVAFSETLVTGRGFLTQTDWSGGGGQALFINPTSYFTSDGNVEINNPAGTLSLKKTFGTYAGSGWLESSTFNTGSVSNFYSILWQPQDQPVDTGPDSLRFQIGTSDQQTPASWDFVGPDGTPVTYYTIANANISAVHNGDQYLRYHALFQTASSTLTPNISDVSFTFTSQCTPPGQVIFSGLSLGNYTLTISRSGYQTAVVTDVSVANPWQQVEVILLPQ